MAVPAVFLNGEPFARAGWSSSRSSPSSTPARRRARPRRSQTKDAVRRAGGRRRACGRGGGDLCRAQGYPHRHRGRALRRAGARHDGDRELHLGAAHRGAQARRASRAARQGLRCRRDEPAAGGEADPGAGRGRAARSAAGQRREPEGADSDPVDRRALAADGRAGRGRVSQQGRGLLPALRRAAVQGQARRGDRRRQFGRRGGDRPGGHRRARHPDRISTATCAPTQCSSASWRQPAQRQGDHSRR